MKMKPMLCDETEEEIPGASFAARLGRAHSAGQPHVALRASCLACMLALAWRKRGATSANFWLRSGTRPAKGGPPPICLPVFVLVTSTSTSASISAPGGLLP